MKRNSWRIEDVLASLTDDYMNLLELPWYKIKRKLSLMKDARQMALNLQVECNEFAKYRLRLRRERESFGLEESERGSISPFQEYFFRYLREPSLSLSEIRETVKHMTGIISQKYIQYSTVLAAIVGGLIGAIVTNIPFLISLILKWTKN